MSVQECHPFHFLLQPHNVALRRFAIKLTGNEHRAEDLVQETFLKAWANREKFILGTQLRGWLFTILRNTFYSDLRKYKREVEDADGKFAALLFEEAAQEHAIELNEVLAALALLPENHRRPLVLMGAFGFSQIEAAEACGVTVGTIKSRVSRGRLNLCRAFGREQASVELPETTQPMALNPGELGTAAPL
ncbi:sigma-70 family RNA polymerase sigma factor [Roseinatronobacter monicus]|uniref:sigma-70 family RNA polymerase sigma factor n=1 Tax=Roseinatronobacter monicus TaxID=393481 RepID=UPI003F665AAA